MSWIILKAPNNQARGERRVLEGEPYQRIEDDGTIWEPVGVDNDDTRQELEFESATGFKLGDSIAKVTKALGIAPCSRCEQRRKVLNRVQELGIKETLRRLKDI